MNTNTTPSNRIMDKIWYVPFDTTTLLSAYDTHTQIPALQAAQSFTATLRTIYVAAQPATPLWYKVLHPQNDILVLSTTSLGTAPPLQRVHYYADTMPIKTALRDFLAETIFLCNDYSGHDHFWLQIDILTVDEDPTHRSKLVQSFTSLANEAGAVFPALLPYTMVANTLDAALDKFLDNTAENVPALTCQIDLTPDGHGSPLLRPGNYILFEHDVDGTAYTLTENMHVEPTAGSAMDITYAVFCIDDDEVGAADFVVSQRVATLLTQLNTSNNPTKTSSEFLTDTLQMYSNFKDLQRYRELKEREPNSLSPAEQALMQRLEQSDDLKPYLPA